MLTSNQAASAEIALRNATYHREDCRWNFEKYVQTHVDNHTILEGLVPHGY